MAHTPGPWTFEIRTDYPNGHVEGIWGPTGEEIVVTDSGYYPPTIDDARLICAAPALLQACKAALNARMYREWPELADFLMAAIRLAEGEA